MRTKSYFNHFIELFISPTEQQLYSQIYKFFIANLQNFVIFEAVSYLALSILFIGAVPWYIYAIAILISVITSWIEIQYGKHTLKHRYQLEQRTSRNINFLIHTLIWAFRVLRFGIITLIITSANNTDFSLLISIFFCITAAMMSTSNYFYRTSLLFIILFILLFITTMFWQQDPILFRHIFMLLASSIVLVIFNITQRKKLFQAVVHSARNQTIAQHYKHSIDKLNQFYRQQSRYLSAASHDLRQPLHALALVVNGTYRQTQHLKAHSALLRMEGAIEHLTDAFNAMLLLSRFDSEKLKPIPKFTPLQSILIQLTQLFDTQIQNKNIVFHLQKTHLWAKTDAPLLLTILKNILLYLIESEGTQKIIIGIRRKENGAHLKIYCRNTHLLNEQFQSIIDFEQQESVSLYIALAKRFCQILQHDFPAVSTQGHVQCLTIKLNQTCTQTNDQSLSISDMHLERQHNESTASNAHYLTPLNNLPHPNLDHTTAVDNTLEHKKVIIIDDDPIIADGIEQLLTDWGMDVSIALSLEMAQEIILDEGRIDLVISDYHLGYINETGLDIIQSLKMDCQEYQTRFVLISGDTTIDLSEMAQNQVDLMLYKPIRPARLRIQLSELMLTKL